MGRRVTFDESFNGSMAELLKETRGASTTGNPVMPIDFPVGLERNTLKGGDKSRTRWKTAATIGDRRTMAADLRSTTFIRGFRSLRSFGNPLRRSAPKKVTR